MSFVPKFLNAFEGLSLTSNFFPTADKINGFHNPFYCFLFDNLPRQRKNYDGVEKSKFLFGKIYFLTLGNFAKFIKLVLVDGSMKLQSTRKVSRALRKTFQFEELKRNVKIDS